MKTYLITEPYDGRRVRVLASSQTAEGAEKQFGRECAARSKHGYSFFSPVRRVIGEKSQVDGDYDYNVADLPTWESNEA